MTSLPELSSFIEGLPEPHIVFDAQYRIVAANSAYRQTFSPQQSVVGRTCYAVSHHFSVPCDQAGESCPLTRAQQSGQRERVLHLHHTPRGEAYVNIELTPLSNAAGKATWFVEKMEPMRVAEGQPAAQGLVGRSAAFRQMLEMVSRVAPSRAAVMLLGESGTGKELVAHALHEASPRAGKAMVAVDCSSLPEALFESELFGHERGAFTGATGPRGGLLEAASGGTLLLDEVGDIPLSMQVKLLRLLETGTYRRVGSTELRHADIRVVSATHRDLPGMVADGRFREDLYYRLCTFPIRLPALRERRDDIALLAPALLERLSSGRRQLSAGALNRLSALDYPGNVRELRNLLERATLLCDGETLESRHIQRAIDVGAWAQPPRRPDVAAGPGAAAAAPTRPTRPLKALEHAALRTALAAHTGSRAALAAQLGISERSLYRKLKNLD